MGRSHTPVVRHIAGPSWTGTLCALLVAVAVATPHFAAARHAAAPGVGIAIRLPGAVSITAVHTYWTRPGRGCALALRTDVDGKPGDVVADGPLSETAGWATTPLAARLAADTPYHLVVTCTGTRGRLGAVRGLPGAASGSWTYERIGRRLRTHARVAPLFALTFADGSWWGQPYRRTRPVSLCAGGAVEQVITPARAAELTAVELPLHGGHAGHLPVDFTLTDTAGSVLLQGPLQPHRHGGIDRLRPTAATAVTLAAGRTYSVRIQASGRRRGCLQLLTRATDLPLGTPASGLALGALSSSRDGGRTWSAHDVALALGLVDGPLPPDDGAATPPGNPPHPTNVRSIYADGYFGAYDPTTVSVWPKKMGVILGEANAQGPLVADARRAAIAAGNRDARFVFYFSLTSIDSRCDCFDEGFYDQVAAGHPDWFLRDAGGNLLSTFIQDYGAQRQFAVDIGNPQMIDAWIDYALAGMDRWGWDGVWIDNILRGNFYGWSGRPVNPRTGASYTEADYRADTLKALERIRRRFDADGKMMIGNHAAAWEAETFADPVVQKQILAMHGLEIEDCVYTFDGGPHSEANWTAQLRYLDFANHHGVLTQCRGGDGAIGSPAKREYVLASYLLTKEGLSNVGQLNQLGNWWNQLDLDLGTPHGGFSCLDPTRGFAPARTCPAPGNVYVRDWQHGRVLVNPSDGATVTVPLNGTFMHAGARVTAVTLPPHSGMVLTK